MSYCLKPACEHPQNPEDASYCLSCGSSLLLQERYRAIALIGQGGFGRTFLAVDESQPSKLRCVIKQFVAQLWDRNNQQQAAELFRQEALRLAVLGQHPQIPELLVHCEQDGQQYLVQEFIEGQNLVQELAEDGAFNEKQIRHLLKDLLPVLGFVHDQQVIHRDIKPDNIIRRTPPTSPCQEGAGGGQLVLVDFGAAKYATGKALAQTGTVIGSAEYAAPEQVKGKAAFTSDLYSLGVTCIHLLTQVSPFDMFDHSEDTWVWQNYLTHPVSNSLSCLLDKLLQRATKRRYQSAQEVLDELNRESIQVVSNSLPIIPANTRQDCELVSVTKNSASLADSSRLVTSVLSATVFDPQTQSWYRIPNLTEDSELVRSVAPFLCSRSPIPSNTLVEKLTPQVAATVSVSKKITKFWWLLSALTAVVVLAVTSVSSQPPSPSLGIEHSSQDFLSPTASRGNC